MRRYWFLLHRYLGIGCGLIMLLWTLSGIVMMYQSYPRLDYWKTLTLQQPLNLSLCCKLPAADPTNGQVLHQLRVDMQAGQPTLRFHTADKRWHSVNLVEGKWLGHYSAEQAHHIAQHFKQHALDIGAVNGNAITHDVIERDQWTVYSSYNPHRPLHRLQLNDQAATDVYISSYTGEIVQLTNAKQRFWGYLGAVVHWIYPTALRQHGKTWYYLIIALSCLGTFLTATGLYIGLKQFKSRRNGKRSPYRGQALYHHYFGLVFGIFTLSWVLSGLLSMNPAGLLEGGSAHQEQLNIRGKAIYWQQLPKLLAPLSQPQSLSATTVRLSWENIGEQIALISHQRDGSKKRFNAITFETEPLDEKMLKHIGQRMLAKQNFDGTVLYEADSYYYAHHRPVEWPVYRMITSNGNRYYLSAVTGGLIKKVDSNEQWNRWLFNGLHSFDFSHALRRRPIWDAVVIILLSGVAVVCATGTYMGLKRLQIHHRRRVNKTCRQLKK